MPEISVLIVNWNGRHFLNECLGALRRQTFRDFETILVDNASTDGSSDYVRSCFPEVRLVQLDENVGFASGNIAGYDQACGQLIALLNNDTEADPNWLEELKRASRDFPKVSTFACKMLHFDQRDRIENCGFGLTAAGLAVDLGRDEADGPDWVDPRPIFGACGGAVAYRRSMLEDVGFFDPDFFMNYEDVDLAFRAQLRGYACTLIPTAIVYHRYGATRKKFPARQAFFSQRNIEFVYLKNMPIGLMFRSLPQRLLYEIGGGLYFFKMGVGMSFIQAKLEAIRKLSSTLNKRRKIQKRTTLTSSQLLSIMVREKWLASKWKKLSSARRPVSCPASELSRR